MFEKIKMQLYKLPWKAIRWWSRTIFVTVLWVFTIVDLFIHRTDLAAVNIGLLIMIRLGDLEQRLDEPITFNLVAKPIVENREN